MQHFSQVYIVASLRTDFLLLFKDMHQLFTSSLLAQACHWACFRFMIESKVLATPRSIEAALTHPHNSLRGVFCLEYMFICS